MVQHHYDRLGKRILRIAFFGNLKTMKNDGNDDVSSFEEEDSRIVFFLLPKTLPINRLKSNAINLLNPNEPFTEMLNAWQISTLLLLTHHFNRNLFVLTKKNTFDWKKKSRKKCSSNPIDIEMLSCRWLLRFLWHLLVVISKRHSALNWF